jgi:type IV pilus assembly protein PilC
VLIFVLASAITLFVWYKNTEKWRASFDYFLLSLPLVGVVYKNYILSSLSLNLGNLVGSGVPVLKALSLTSKSINNVVYQSILSDVISRVSTWNKIVDSMAEVDPENDFFPADFLQMLSVWEKTASLEKVSKKINEQYTREVNYSLASLTKWIEPLAILIAGIFVLWFAFAIFGAILKVTQTVS